MKYGRVIEIGEDEMFIAPLSECEQYADRHNYKVQAAGGENAFAVDEMVFSSEDSVHDFGRVAGEAAKRSGKPIEEIVSGLIDVILGHDFIDNNLTGDLMKDVAQHLGIENQITFGSFEDEDAAVTEDKDRKNGLYGPEYDGESF